MSAIKYIAAISGGHTTLTFHAQNIKTTTQTTTFYIEFATEGERVCKTEIYPISTPELVERKKHTLSNVGNTLNISLRTFFAVNLKIQQYPDLVRITQDGTQVYPEL